MDYSKEIWTNQTNQPWILRMETLVVMTLLSSSGNMDNDNHIYNLDNTYVLNQIYLLPSIYNKYIS